MSLEAGFENIKTSAISSLLSLFLLVAQDISSQCNSHQYLPASHFPTVIVIDSCISETASPKTLPSLYHTNRIIIHTLSHIAHTTRDS